MSKEKQIEELAEILRKVCDATPNGKCMSKLCCACRAETVIEAGYRKQEEGEWMKERMSKFEHRYNCSNCNYRRFGKPTPHCPNCGARMGGGAE
jgi:hypothetical protein